MSVAETRLLHLFYAICRKSILACHGHSAKVSSTLKKMHLPTPCITINLLKYEKILDMIALISFQRCPNILAPFFNSISASFESNQKFIIFGSRAVSEHVGFMHLQKSSYREASRDTSRYPALVPVDINTRYILIH